MAIFHAHLKSISRADGRSATAAIAYRAGCNIVDERTGLEFDYSKKKGVEHTEIFFPPGEDDSRPDLHDTSALWNEVEQRETKSNAQVARDFEFSFPCELNAEKRQRMLSKFCSWLVKNHGVVAQGCIHAPHGKDADERNYHAHILFSTRRFENGQFTEKTREFSKNPYDKKELEKYLAKGGEDYTKRLHCRKSAAELLREAYQEIGNHSLVEAGFEPTLDRRSYIERGIAKEPTVHEGAGRAMSKRGLQSDTHETNQKIIERNKTLDELDKEIIVTLKTIQNLDNDYGDLSQFMFAYEAQQRKQEAKVKKEAEAKQEAEAAIQRRQKNELAKPQITLDSLSLIKHIQYQYDNYFQDLIKRTKLQDEALKKGDNSKALYYMQMKYESINHCLSKQDIEELSKTKLFIMNDRLLLDALVQQRILSSSNRDVESAESSVNNALTSCERSIERELTVSVEVNKSFANDMKRENTRTSDNYGNTFE